MAEYIERDKLPQKIGYWDNYSNGWNDCLDAIAKIPAADVRPVVLCRDCKYWKQWDDTSNYVCTYVAGARFIRKADDFCSRGADLRGEAE